MGVEVTSQGLSTVPKTLQYEGDDDVDAMLLFLKFENIDTSVHVPGTDLLDTVIVPGTLHFRHMMIAT